LSVTAKYFVHLFLQRELFKVILNKKFCTNLSFFVLTSLWS